MVFIAIHLNVSFDVLIFLQYMIQFYASLTRTQPKPTEFGFHQKMMQSLKESVRDKRSLLYCSEPEVYPEFLFQSSKSFVGSWLA